jgi:hypothetical protein
MAKIDEDEVKRVSAALNRHKHAPRLGPPTSKILTKNKAEAEKIFTSYFTKTGLPAGKLKELAAKNQIERQKLDGARLAAATENAGAAEAEFHQGMRHWAQALEILSVPFQSSFITLDKPFLIWELPHPETNIWIDSHVESLNSFVKFEIITNSGAHSTTFVFYFIWSNDSDFAAVINVDTSLVLNGLCQVLADDGILSGHHNYLSLAANLLLMRWSGWGVDPATGASNDQTPFPFGQSTQFQFAAQLDQYGGDWFDDPSGDNERTFLFRPFPLSADLIPIPARATMLFEVSLTPSYFTEDGGGGLNDRIAIDFAQDKFSRRVICPFVRLELLTPAPAAS